MQRSNQKQGNYGSDSHTGHITGPAQRSQNFLGGQAVQDGNFASDGVDEDFDQAFNNFVSGRQEPAPEFRRSNGDSDDEDRQKYEQLEQMAARDDSVEEEDGQQQVEAGKPEEDFGALGR